MDLALKYRPKTFAEIVGQNIVVGILTKQIAEKKWQNCYLFCGAHGCGKTTCARIFADEINNHQGEPIEIDAASHNGVDDIRNLINDAQQRSIDCDYKVYVIDECVTGDTEILTEQGWKRFDSLNKTERVAQYTLDGNIEFVMPSEYIEKDYMGNMYDIAIGDKAIFSMSPNHVQPLLYSKSNKIKEKYIKDIKFCQANKFIRAGKGVGTANKLSAIDRLAICLQADGTLQQSYDTYNYWTIQLTRDRKKDRLLKILSDSQVEYKEIISHRPNSIRYAIKTDATITKLLATHFDLTDMSYLYAKDFIEELMLWDGHIHNNKYYYYSSVIKENVDFCQAVGVLGGYSSRIAIEQDNRSETFRDVYRLYLQEKNFNSSNACVSKTERNFNDKIYCVKVPSHMIVIRKDGYELVTGNCHMISGQGWNAALKLIEEPPSNTIFIFCTTNPEKLPQTILSRVQRFDFRRIDRSLISDRLEFIMNEELHRNYTREALDRISSQANGHMRDAIKLLDRCLSATDEINIDNVESTLGLVKIESIVKFVFSILSKNYVVSLEELKRVESFDSNLIRFYDEILSFVVECCEYVLTENNDLISTSFDLEQKRLLMSNKDKLKLFLKRMIEIKSFVDDSNVLSLLKTLVIEMSGDTDGN